MEEIEARLSEKIEKYKSLGGRIYFLSDYPAYHLIDDSNLYVESSLSNKEFEDLLDKKIYFFEDRSWIKLVKQSYKLS